MSLSFLYPHSVSCTVNAQCWLHSICCEKPYFILLACHQPWQERAPIDYFKEKSDKIRSNFRLMSLLNFFLNQRYFFFICK